MRTTRAKINPAHNNGFTVHNFIRAQSTACHSIPLSWLLVHANIEQPALWRKTAR